MFFAVLTACSCVVRLPATSYFFFFSGPMKNVYKRFYCALGCDVENGVQSLHGRKGFFFSIWVFSFNLSFHEMEAEAHIVRKKCYLLVHHLTAKYSSGWFPS